MSPLEPICPDCGSPIKFVEAEDGERIALDTIPTIDGRYRLDPNDANRAELMDRPGRQGFNDHATTCAGR